jgi:S1-C subfamily serine protease
LKNRVLPTVIIALAGAIVGSFLMMLYASTHFANVAGPENTPPAVSAAPLTGVSDQDRIVSAVRRTKSSVVAITEEVNGKQVIPLDPFMQQFFGQGGGPGIVQPYHGQASGSGFVYDDKGDIITNAHVVTPPAGGQISKLTVVFANGDHEPAHVVSASIGADIAIIKVDGYAKLPAGLQFADSDRLQQGQWAIAIGEPLELQQTVTVGVVSAFNRDEPIANESGQVIDFKGLLQTSAPINPGNSGGPLIDIEGHVIGINQSTARGGTQGIGFAIPSNTARKVVLNLLAHPGVHQGTNEGFIGIQLTNISSGFRNQSGYNGQGGVGVGAVIPGSPADQAGIQPGDVILSADGHTYSNVTGFQAYIKSKKPGDTVRLQLWSQGLKKETALTLTERPAGEQEQQAPPDDGQ